MSNRLLELKNVSFSYGVIPVIKNINLEINKGEIVSLLGGNGAGKSTTLRLISGIANGTYSGDIVFKNQSILGKKSWDISEIGIAHCLEGRHIFSQLTVLENLKMGAFLRKKQNYEDDLNYVFSLFPILKERLYQLGGTLSGGEQQMLAVGRALMQKPELLILDEPSLGLSPLYIEQIFNTLKEINKKGITILLIEQNTSMALSISHRSYVIENGEIIMQDESKNMLKNEAIKKSYLGD